MTKAEIAALAAQISKSAKAEVQAGLGAKKSVEAVSTGSMLLDILTGCGGIPYGRITLIYGEEGAGKTSLALSTLASAQIKGELVGVVDMEHAINFDYAQQSAGLDPSSMIFCQPESGEEALEVAKKMIESGAVKVVLLDSLAACVPQKEVEGDMDTNAIGAQARLLSHFFRVVSPLVRQHNVALICINQIRLKIGVTHGSPETLPGGVSQNFYAGLKLRVSKPSSGKIEDEADKEYLKGYKMRVYVKKSKVGPLRQTPVDAPFHFIGGFNPDVEIADEAARIGVLERSGAWYSFEGVKLGQGIDNTRERIAGDDELYGRILRAIDQWQAAREIAQAEEAAEAMAERRRKAQLRAERALAARGNLAVPEMPAESSDEESQPKKQRKKK